ncbi:MAG: hypothetical protein OXL37_16935 [Chloroflexota bacterium]|nr:hypothetical protein [Chloroflexota bacterium]MDE2961087.1 hypothetical protein [Chloroflexota bacterium]
MKTITISMDDETYHLYQHNAEAAGISVEEWVTSRLAGVTPPLASSRENERRRETWYRIQANIDARAKARGDELRTAKKLTREELHDRDALR